MKKAGRQQRVMSIVAERGENIRALMDELDEMIVDVKARALINRANEELKQGAAALGYRFLDNGPDLDRMQREVMGKDRLVRGFAKVAVGLIDEIEFKERRGA